ncbi:MULTISPECIES: aldo/keto reductase [unclassified Paracoccus (in: a-proteobacteria)]|uniref:aldo/keto reductase n=1 Tax=unclassified Paracoccus (in: a-proteobacteria) TaxID=2688777 RepID=UPI0012B400F7|nr:MULTISPECIES: aldo/keto reductase [unclassified Paracoccus (in: a-proteobacteria)]UXU76148.1 aldo/keto reductase [Paracoccus sp. SMMA_5]UXU81646.1 aldo/keto reductase [Paracoccus sp. SMMA_5_TC]
MRQMTLGNSSVQVSAVSLGTMTFGNQTSAAEAHAQLDRALAAGITLFDTAELYPVNPVRRETVGLTETIIGDWLATRGGRDRVQIATKAAGPGDKVRAHGYDGATLRQTIDDSLRRLRCDHIDLYQLHWPVRGSYAFRQNWRYDPSTQNRAATLAHMQDVLEALDQAMRAGKIRAIGLSNESAWGAMRWIDTAEAMGAPRMVSIQNEYSLMYRAFDTDLAEVAVNEGLVLLAYSPLAAGLLTGKYRRGVVPPASRIAADRASGGPGDLGGRFTPRASLAVEAWHGLAAELGLDPIHMAIAFTRQRPFATIPILGATDLAQLDHLLAGLDLVLSDQALKSIDKLHRSHPLPF